MNTPEVTTIVNDAVAELLGDMHDPDEALPTDASFADLGLNSLMIARLVIMLETETGLDPFTGDTSIVDVHTIGELVTVYTEARKQPAEVGS
ncbi:acyl carrier protein [Myceligenerans crystallogenes]|uniref:Carrier domain-containing protein n=1 Tax=Myceligenerans crystallogenes TaxID=316335 RepID=A0ABP4ZU23_9MICO